MPLPIVYGFPTHETFERADGGEIRLGGCVVGSESPSFCCPRCDAPFPFREAADGGPIIPDWWSV